MVLGTIKISVSSIIFSVIAIFLANCGAIAQEINAYPTQLDPDYYSAGASFEAVGSAVSDNDTIMSVEYQVGSTTGTWLTCTTDNLMNTGTADSSTFVQGTGFNGTVLASATQDDGKLIAVGSFTSYNGTASGGIVRLNADGTYDSTFNVGSGFNVGSQAFDVVIQEDGKIIVGGGFTTYNGTTVNGLVRINTDGSRDTDFHTNSSALFVYDVDLFNDEKILIGGSLSTYDGTNSRGVVKLNTDGTLDTDFLVGAGFQGTQSQVRSVAIFEDDKVLVGGRFTTYQGVSSNRLTKLNADATLDTDFSAGSGPFGIYVHDIKILDDGKIMIGGDFTSYNGTNARGIARVNADGSIDSSFNSVSGVSGGGAGVFSLHVLENDKIIAGGNFTSYQGNSTNDIVSINSDGSFDSSMGFGTKFNSTIFKFEVIDGHQLFVAGAFTNFDSTGPSYFGKFNYRYSAEFTCTVTANAQSGIYSIYFKVTDDSANTISTDFPSINFEVPSLTTADVFLNVFRRDRKCRPPTPEELTWIKLKPRKGGLYIEWTQYLADKISIYIDDGTGKYPWVVYKTINDGHEFLPNVDISQSIRVRAYNGCKSSPLSIPFSYAQYPLGWYRNISL